MTGREVLRGGRGKPTLGLGGVARRAETAGGLMAETRLGARVAGLGGASIPVRGLFEILVDHEPLRIEFLQHRRGLGLAGDALQGGRRRGGRRGESGQVNLPEACHREQRALVGGGAVPADRFEKILEHALTTFIGSGEAQLGLAEARLRELTIQGRGFGETAHGLRRLGTFERDRRRAAPRELAQEIANAHGRVGSPAAQGSAATSAKGSAPVSRPRANANWARATCQPNSALMRITRAFAAAVCAVNTSMIVPTPD